MAFIALYGNDISLDIYHRTFQSEDIFTKNGYVHLKSHQLVVLLRVRDFGQSLPQALLGASVK